MNAACYTRHTEAMVPGQLCRPTVLAYSSYSDAACYTVASSTHIVHQVITKHTEAELVTVSGYMHAYQTRRADFGKQAQLLSA